MRNKNREYDLIIRHLLCFCNGSAKIFIRQFKNLIQLLFFCQFISEVKMKESNYKSYDELPLFLNANIVSKVLGISSSSGYELMHTDGFPVLKIGSRLVVPKEKFREWVEQNTGGSI